MPYVEGFGTWPFGEEWLWEAITTSYLPLLDLLARDAPLSLSLTPVLCDQLEGQGVPERYTAFLDQVRRHTHHEDARGLRAGGHDALAAEVLRSWGDYERALQRFAELDGDLLNTLAPYVQWTSAATHAVLPLLATDAGLDAQVRVGIDSHRARFGPLWRGGFWLPECAHAPWIEPILSDVGVHATCVELTDAFGPDSSRHLQPLLSESGLRLLPIDRATISLVWSDAGYPANGDYRDYHHHTIHHHNPWANHGGGYDHARALALARTHAADFVSRTRTRIERLGRGLPGGGLVVCALDTELLGHWWYEGIAWLAAVVDECAAQGLELVRLDDALERFEPAPTTGIWRDPEHVTTWGAHSDLSTWSSPAVADIAFAIRAAELAAIHAGSELASAALRQLLALQSSDWAFMVARDLAVPYARQRFEGHRQGFYDALAQGLGASAEPLRNLAVHGGVMQSAIPTQRGPTPP